MSSQCDKKPVSCRRFHHFLVTTDSYSRDRILERRHRDRGGISIIVDGHRSDVLIILTERPYWNVIDILSYPIRLRTVSPNILEFCTLYILKSMICSYWYSAYRSSLENIGQHSWSIESPDPDLVMSLNTNNWWENIDSETIRTYIWMMNKFHQRLWNYLNNFGDNEYQTANGVWDIITNLSSYLYIWSYKKSWGGGEKSRERGRKWGGGEEGERREEIIMEDSNKI